MLLVARATDTEKCEVIDKIRTCDAVMANAYKAVEVSSYVVSTGAKGFPTSFAPTHANLPIGQWGANSSRSRSDEFANAGCWMASKNESGSPPSQPMDYIEFQFDEPVQVHSIRLQQCELTWGFLDR